MAPLPWEACSVSDPTYFHESRFEAVWPRKLVQAELDRLLRPAPGRVFSGTWHGEVFWFLTEVFSSEAANEFTRVYAYKTYRPGFEPTEALEWLDGLKA